MQLEKISSGEQLIRQTTKIRQAQSWIFERMLEMRIQYLVHGPRQICGSKPNIDPV